MKQTQCLNHIWKGCCGLYNRKYSNMILNQISLKKDFPLFKHLAWRFITYCSEKLKSFQQFKLIGSHIFLEYQWVSKYWSVIKYFKPVVSCSSFQILKWSNSKRISYNDTLPKHSPKLNKIRVFEYLHIIC